MRFFLSILLIFGLMKPTSLYLLALIEIYIFDFHFGLQMQGGILHRHLENHVFFCQNCYEIVKKSLILLANDGFEMTRL